MNEKVCTDIANHINSKYQQRTTSVTSPFLPTPKFTNTELLTEYVN